jgi:hypothetical protein
MAKTFTPTRQSNPCQLCDDTTGKCRQTTSTLLCMTLTDALDTPPGFTFIGRTKDHLWGKWVVGQRQDWSDDQRVLWQRERQQRQVERERAEAQRQATALSALERDRYYQQLLDQLSLHPADQNALSARGLSAAQLQTWGVKSVEQWQRLEPSLPHTLPGVSLSGERLNVAGAGFLCPIRDVNGLLVGFQLRLRVAETGGRYRWLTSATKKRPHGPTPHLPHGELPLAVHRPPQVQHTAIALVEGTGPKPFILSQRRSQVVVGAAGGQFASSPQTLQHTLAVLAAELDTQTVEFFPDAGAISNRQVMRQYRRTWTLLRQWGYQVRVAWWGQDTKAAPDIDELEALDERTPLTWLTTAQLEVMAHPRLDWLARIQARLQRSLSPQVAAAALRRTLEGPDPNLVAYAAGDRLATWQQAVAQGYQFVLDQSPTGTGKSFDAGLVESAPLQAQQVFYVSDQHRNPTVETLTAAQGWVDLEARHAGLIQETTPGGGRRVKRAASGETPQTPASCARTRLLGALRAKHVAGADTAALICGTCPLKEACTHATGPGYGFLNQRQAALASPKLRAHPASLPIPEDYVYDAVALVWDEPGQSFVTKHDIPITLTDLEQTLTALLSYPALFAAIQPLATTLLPYLKGQQRLGRFGLSHTDVVATLAVPTVNVSELEQVLQPDLAFLNPTAVHGVDLADLPATLRKRFSERDAEVATQAQQRVLKQWLPDLVRVLTGQVRGSVRLEPGVLTLSLADTRHQAIAQAAGVVIFLDATLSRQDLALKLGCDPKAIYVCRQQVPTPDNLTLVQVTDLGRLGLQRGADQQRRVAALVAHYQALDPDTKVIDFKRFTPEGMGAWWRDSRGVNDFTATRTLLLVGTPCRNLADLQAEYALLTGCQEETDAGFTAFVDRAIRADIHQALGRLRAHRRPEEPLQVVLLSDFALDIPTQPVKASTITLAAAGKFEGFLLAVQQAGADLKVTGVMVTQTALAKLSGYSQSYISRYWHLLQTLLALSDSNSHKQAAAPPDPETAAVLASVSHVLTLVAASSTGVALLESVGEAFLTWLQPEQWSTVWHRLPLETQIRVLAALLLTLPADALTSLTRTVEPSLLPSQG